MKSAKYLLPLLFLATGLVSTKAYAQEIGAGQESEFERRTNETENRPVREFVQSKENVDVKQKQTNLEISGDVHFEWRHLNEEGNKIFVIDNRFEQVYLPIRGNDAIDYRFLPVSRNDWDVEFNLKVKYTYKDAWAAAHLQFDNSAGIRGFNDCIGTVGVFGANSYNASLSDPYISSSSIVSGVNLGDVGSFNSDSSGVFPRAVTRNAVLACKGSGESGAINLKRAYMGYNIYADGVHRLDLEMGRRKLNDIFDSEIQFSARFDGVVFKYTSAIDRIAECYLYAGAFIIDERTNHYGYVFEAGFLDIFTLGLDLKYSLIDWRQRGENRCFVRNPLGQEFLNSQFTFEYKVAPEIRCRKIPLDFYGAFVINHAARPTRFTHYQKKNLGFYAGLMIGEVDKQGDWSFDITYEYVQAQMASDCDVSGIGYGNLLEEHFTDVLVIYNSDGDLVDYLIPRRGNTNYKGWSFEFFYAITDNLSLNVIYEFTRPEDRSIGGRHFYSNAEVEAIYAF